MIQNLKKNWFSVSKMTRIWSIFTWAFETLKISTLIGSLCAKYITFDLKKYRGVILHDTEWCKILRKTNLWFGKWHEDYGMFSPEHLKVSKLGLWWGPFIQIIKCMRPKFKRELIWRGIDLSFQNWHEEFDKFWPKDLKVPKICTLMGSFWPKYIMFELKKYRGVMFHYTEEWCKTRRKTDFWFEKWHEEFGKFLPEHWKVSNLGLWWDSFIESRKCISLKFTEELRVMKMKNDAKFKEELNCPFKIDMRNLINFDQSTWKSQKFTL